MRGRAPYWRRDLARELSRQAGMDVAGILAQAPEPAGVARRIGITGAPGAGKSSLIAELARLRLGQGRDVAVLAIDPTSPISSGSLLGDRIRMDQVAQDERLFIRSVPTGACHDGLCNNVVGLLDTLDAAGFDDLILETVGVGQVSYEARRVVETLVLFLVPESGDTIQAMKAGALEMADIYVVNKADLPTAERTARELRGVLRLRRGGGGWEPPIILASAVTGRGVEELAAAIDAHGEAMLTDARRNALRRDRRAHQLLMLLRQRTDEIFAEQGTALLSRELAEAYAALLSAVAEAPASSPQPAEGAGERRRSA